MQEMTQFDLSVASGYRYSVNALSGVRFKVQATPGSTLRTLAAFFGRAWVNLTGGSFDSSTAVTQFVGNTGPAPVLTYNSFFIAQGNNQALTFEVEGTWQDFSFSSFVTEQSFSSRTQDPGAKWYRPLSYAVPFGIGSVPPNSETFLLFQCVVLTPEDPGPFVKLVPLSPDLGG
jgi:hypothetical protein